LNADMTGLVTAQRSAAEEIQERAPRAKVVKAFNTVFAAKQAEAQIDDVPLDGFYAGDDADAKKVVAELLTSIGYRPIDAGPLANARALEAMGFLNIWLNANNGWPWQSGWKLLGPAG
jgi:predicted dinucleotide-binding enzyme